MIDYPLPDFDPEGYFLYHSIGMYPDKEAEMESAFSHFSRSWSRLDDGQWMHGRSQGPEGQ